MSGEGWLFDRKCRISKERWELADGIEWGDAQGMCFNIALGGLSLV